jgi:hypothetical protein
LSSNDRLAIIPPNVRLVDRDGAAVKDAQGATYSRKLTANENPKSVAHRLLRTHYSATRHKTVNGFDGPIFYPKMKRV